MEKKVKNTAASVTLVFVVILVLAIEIAPTQGAGKFLLFLSLPVTFPIYFGNRWQRVLGIVLLYCIAFLAIDAEVYGVEHDRKFNRTDTSAQLNPETPTTIEAP